MKTLRVGLVLTQFTGFGEGIREGIARFGATRPRWEFAPLKLENLPEAADQVDGVLGGLGEPRLRAALQARRLPFVELLHGPSTPRCPAVYSDERQIGEQAAEHLLGAGFTHLASYSRGNWRPDLPIKRALSSADQRVAGFVGRAWEAGVEPSCLHATWPAPARRLTEALAGLPTPLGLMCIDDPLARITLEAAALAGRRVPDDLAVVGVNDSILICAFSNPPLSSVRPDWERIGYEGAALLQRLMAGEPPPDGPVLIPPLGVTVRQSSDVLAIEDPDVAAAMRWVRDHAHEPGDVGDLLKALPMPRRSIERKFRAALGYSPAQAMRRAKIEHVKRLLIHTDWPMPRVAAQSAFRDAKDLATQFKKMTGQPPTVFRARHRTID